MCACPWLQRLSSLLATNYVLRNHVLIIFYIRRVISTGYKIINFIKFLKGSIAARARISNIKSRKKRTEPRSRKLGKRGSK